ncbi:MAG: aminotransferase class V-fold PLP-dependent enzyme [Lachnospiraceae bacterium]|nr:aminotransferase class V-fold PLP-dependent enzyme [Lachnospiraceae bacterium]
MIYLNNAATSFPKPSSVRQAVIEAVSSLPPGQYRSTSLRRDLFDDCRKLLGELLGIRDTERIFFSSGATESLNALLYGLAVPSEQIITTVTEHNSVLRPLFNLPSIAGKPVLLPCDPDGVVAPELFEAEAKKGRARAIVLNHCSNVTGAVQDAEAIGRIAKQYGLLFILDVSQSAGCIPVCAERFGADALAFTGHKSLMGIQGTGGYYVKKGIPFKPLLYGGTGRDSERLVYETDYEYEMGTGNTPGIAALLAGVSWVLDRGVSKIQRQEKVLSEYALTLLSELADIRIFGARLSERGPLISFQSVSFSPADLAYILQNSLGIVTRAGLQCAPLIHDCIGSGKQGTLRISFSPFNTKEEIEALQAGLKELTCADGKSSADRKLS